MTANLGVAGGYPENGTQTMFQANAYIDGYGTEQCERDGYPYPPDEHYPLSYSFPAPLTVCDLTDLVVAMPDGRVDRLVYSKQVTCSGGESEFSADVVLDAVWP